MLPCSLFSETLNVPTELASSTALLKTALRAFSAGDEPNFTETEWAASDGSSVSQGVKEVSRKSFESLGPYF